MFIRSAAYILSLGILTSIQVRHLWSRNEKREAWVYASSMTVSAVVGVLLIADIEVPTLVLPFEMVFKSIGKSILSH